MKNLSSIKKNDPKPTYGVIVVDGNNVCYKYVGPPFSNFSTRDGQPSGIFYGMLKYMKYLRKEFGAPGCLLVYCWDGPESSVLRKAVQADYKANRDHSSDGYIFKQLEAFSALLKLYGYASLSGPAEADDLAKTVAGLSGEPMLLVSEDKDWEQLLDGKKAIWKPRSKVMLTDPLPYNFVVYRVLRGDACDNIRVSGLYTEEEARALARKYDSVGALVKGEQGKLSQPGVDELVKREKLFQLYDCPEVVKGLKVLRRGPRDEQAILETLGRWDISKPEEYLW